MENNSSEDVARQLGSAFAAAFPAQTQAQSTPQSTQATTSPNGATICGYCKCQVSEFLTTRLRDVAACPTCTTNSMIITTQQIKQRLIERGGAFLSKEQQAGHKRIKQDWRIVKITLANGVAKWEALADNASVPTDDLTNVRKALEIWDKNKMQLARVPGVRYGREEPTEGEHEIARLTMELLRLILEKEMAAEDKVPRSARSGESLGHDPQQDSSSTAQEHAGGAGTMFGQAVMASTPPPPSSAPGTPKSILKRKTSTTLPNTPSKKRIRISDTVTISPPRLNISNPSPFTDLPDTVTTQTHAEHTSAQRHRRRRSFKRSAPNYLPGVWASGAFEEKARTSSFKSSWEQTDAHVAEELKEAQDEQEVFRGIKAVSSAWVGVWWIRSVTRHVDPEQWKEKMHSP